LKLCSCPARNGREKGSDLFSLRRTELCSEEPNTDLGLFSPNNPHSLLLLLVRNGEVELAWREDWNRKYEPCAVWRNIAYQTLDRAAPAMVTNLAAQIRFVPLMASPLLHVGLLWNPVPRSQMVHGLFHQSSATTD
jgi:hypothetical protein